MDKSILDVVHDSAKDLHDAELISPRLMREFDALCLQPDEEHGIEILDSGHSSS